MSDPRHALGLDVEEAVTSWLTRCGWSVLLRRARAPGGGEVDIIAIDTQDVLVAVEVRARRHARAGSASESVDGRRVIRMRRTLAAVAHTAPPHDGVRLDLVAAEPAAGARGSWRLVRTPDIGGR